MAPLLRAVAAALVLTAAGAAIPSGCASTADATTRCAPDGAISASVDWVRSRVGGDLPDDQALRAIKDGLEHCGHAIRVVHPDETLGDVYHVVWRHDADPDGADTMATLEGGTSTQPRRDLLACVRHRVLDDAAVVRVSGSDTLRRLVFRFAPVPSAACTMAEAVSPLR